MNLSVTVADGRANESKSAPSKNKITARSFRRKLDQYFAGGGGGGVQRRRRCGRRRQEFGHSNAIDMDGQAAAFSLQSADGGEEGSKDRLAVVVDFC